MCMDAHTVETLKLPQTIDNVASNGDKWRTARGAYRVPWRVKRVFKPACDLAEAELCIHGQAPSLLERHERRVRAKACSQVLL